MIVHWTELTVVWPTSSEDLQRLQLELAVRSRREPAWRPPPDRALRVGGVFVASPRGGEGVGAPGDPAWVAAVVLEHGSILDSVVVRGQFDAPYVAGLLALREGRLLAEALACLCQPPDVVIVNASGRDHPRRAGVAVHLGAACGVPTIGVTDRPLLADGRQPAPERGATAELCLDDEVVAYRLRTGAGIRPVVVHAGWRVDAQTACTVVLQVSRTSRTPAPLREARRLARSARADRQLAQPRQ
jgi:deoxyribonuclease V